MTVLELYYFDPQAIRDELAAKIKQAPGFFENLPVIFDLDKLQTNEGVSFPALIGICNEYSIKVVAIRGGNQHLHELAKEAGLSLLAQQKERSTQQNEATSPPPSNTQNPEAMVNESKQQAPEQTQEQVRIVKETVVETKIERQQSKVVHHPIRSGQQVYAADGDLIILASVSAGAEILADGNIHVYGALRGRALAGVKGDTKARIFCHSMQAELVSIAGQYKISEDIDKSVVGKPAQVFLEENKLKFKPLEY